MSLPDDAYQCPALPPVPSKGDPDGQLGAFIGGAAAAIDECHAKLAALKSARDALSGTK